MLKVDFLEHATGTLDNATHIVYAPTLSHYITPHLNQYFSPLESYLSRRSVLDEKTPLPFPKAARCDAISYAYPLPTTSQPQIGLIQTCWNPDYSGS